jgi:hypothetical protein
MEGNPLRSNVHPSDADSHERENPEPGGIKSSAAKAERLDRNRRWREEHREALEAYAREIDRDGLALARFRTF